MSERVTGNGDRGTGRFDRAIAGAVREMLDVEPRADLRARVMREISGSQVASGFSRKNRLLWLRVPIAAAATILLAILLPSRTAQQPPAPGTTIAVNDPAPSPRVAPPAETPTATAPAPTTTAQRIAPASSSPRTAAHNVVEAASLAAAGTMAEVEPLRTIAPIEVAPIAEHRVAPAEISVAPLTPIVELQIAPLNPPERRN